MYSIVLMLQGYGHSGAYCFRESSWTAIDAEYKFVKKRFIARCLWKTLSILRPQLRQPYSRNGHFKNRRQESWNLNSKIRSH